MDMGANNGGFLLDVSEVGVCFQWFPGIMPLRGGETVQLKFKLPGMNIPIEAEGQFVRHGDSQKFGGMRFVNLPAEVRPQIRKWVARQEHAEAAISGDPGVLPETRPSPALTISEKREPVGVAVNLATAKPELPTATALASLSPTKSQTEEGTHVNGRAADV